MSRYERFEMMKLHRLELRNADYNPRSISAQAKKRLKRGIEQHGMVMPIIWNKRTKNIVGGHQRIESLDQLEGSDDYSITVAVIDVPLTQEKKINTLINNQSTMGFFDEDKLLKLLREEEGVLDVEDYGFGKNDQDRLMALLNAHDTENLEIVAAMTEGREFEDMIMDVEPEIEREREVQKISRKQSYESQVDALMVDKDETAWKLKTDEEKKHYDSRRSNYREETFGYSFVKISFKSEDDKKSWLKKNELPPDRETVHSSELK